MVEFISMHHKSHPHIYVYNCHSGLWERMPLMNLIAFKCYRTTNQFREIWPLKTRSAIVTAIRYSVVNIKKAVENALEGEWKYLRKTCQEEPICIIYKNSRLEKTS